MKFDLNIGEPPSKTKYDLIIDSEKYCEGKKMKRTMIWSEIDSKNNTFKQL